MLAGASQGRHSRIHSSSDLAAMQRRNASPHVRSLPDYSLCVCGSVSNACIRQDNASK